MRVLVIEDDPTLSDGLRAGLTLHGMTHPVSLDVTYNGQSVFRLESDIAISEDPSFSFSIRPSDPAAAGVIKAEVLDSSQRHFSQSWPVPAAAQM